MLDTVLGCQNQKNENHHIIEVYLLVRGDRRTNNTQTCVSVPEFPLVRGGRGQSLASEWLGLKKHCLYGRVSNWSGFLLGDQEDRTRSSWERWVLMGKGLDTGNDMKHPRTLASMELNPHVPLRDRYGDKMDMEDLREPGTWRSL